MVNNKVFYEQYKFPIGVDTLLNILIRVFFWVAVGVVFLVASIHFYLSGIIATILYWIIGIIAVCVYFYLVRWFYKDLGEAMKLEMNDRMIILSELERKEIWLEDIKKLEVTILIGKDMGRNRTQNIVKKYIIWEGRKKHILDFYEEKLWVKSLLHITINQLLHLDKRDYAVVEKKNAEGIRMEVRTYTF